MKQAEFAFMAGYKSGSNIETCQTSWPRNEVTPSLICVDVAFVGYEAKYWSSSCANYSGVRSSSVQLLQLSNSLARIAGSLTGSGFEFFFFFVEDHFSFMLVTCSNTNTFWAVQEPRRTAVKPNCQALGRFVKPVGMRMVSLMVLTERCQIKLLYLDVCSNS